MEHEKSCGAVVFTRTEGGIRYLMVRSVWGNWGFPKGHVEEGETEEETALREIYEETNLRVTLLEGFRETDEYLLRRKENAGKQVVYFCGEYPPDGQVRVQASEIMSAEAVPLEKGLRLLRYESARKILRKADEFIAKTRGS